MEIHDYIEQVVDYYYTCINSQKPIDREVIKSILKGVEANTLKKILESLSTVVEDLSK